MHNLSFIIRGNQEDSAGNPVPYERTLNHSWRKRSQRYHDWCHYVRAQMLDSLSHTDTPIVLTTEGKLRLKEGECARVSLMVSWANEKHGDLDNVLKGILDAVFEDDKQVTDLWATSDYAVDGRGMAVVLISIFSNKK